MVYCVKKIIIFISKNMEKKKKILIWGIILLSLILAFIIFWNWWEDTTEETNTSTWTTFNENGKIDFFIETKKSTDFNKVSYLEKTAKVISGEDLTLTSQANWKINKIYVKEWDNVANWQKVIDLVDSIGAYWLNLEKANIWVDGAKIDYSSQKVNLNKAVDDAKINLEKAENEYVNTKKSLEKTLEQSKLSLDSSKTVDVDTTLTLQLQKLNNNLAKAELDVENLKQNNIEQLKSFQNSALSTYDLLDNLMTDIIDFSDTILGITPQNKKLNDDYENFLWKKDSQHLADTEQLFKDFSIFKETSFDTLDIESLTFGSGSQEDYDKIFLIGDEWYNTAKTLLKDLTRVLDTSIVSVWSLWQPEINAYKSQINWYESQTQWSYSSYLGFKSQVRTFLNTYKNSEKSAKENLKLLEDEISILQKSKNISDTDFGTALENNTLSYEKAEIDAQKNIKNLEISLKNAKLVYQNAKDVREVTLRKMNNNIKLSQNTSNQAYKEYAKLSLKSSIYWVITDILVDTGQDVSAWTPIVNISNLKEIKAEVGLSEKELDFVKQGQKVVVNYWEKQILGKIKSISPVADDNLMYKTTIEFSQKFKTIWWLVDIQIPVKTKQTLVPINMVEVTGEAKWVLKTLSWGLLENYPIELWKVWGDKIEISSKFPNNLDIITTNISNFDEAKFDLKIKWEDTIIGSKEDENDDKEDQDRWEVEKNKEDVEDEFEGR